MLSGQEHMRSPYVKWQMNGVRIEAETGPSKG
jgi:hypothetical protein